MRKIAENILFLHNNNPLEHEFPKGISPTQTWLIHPYLLIVDFQIRHADAVIPSFTLVFSLDQIEHLAHSPRDHAWLFRAAHHGVGLTCGRGSSESECRIKTYNSRTSL